MAKTSGTTRASSSTNPKGLGVSESETTGNSGNRSASAQVSSPLRSLLTSIPSSWGARKVEVKKVSNVLTAVVNESAKDSGNYVLYRLGLGDLNLNQSHYAYYFEGGRQVASSRDLPATHPVVKAAREYLQKNKNVYTVDIYRKI